MTESKLKKLIQNKNVIYITVKNKDYIRTSQIRRFLKENASGVKIVTSEKSNAFLRASDLRKKIDVKLLQNADVVIAGFLPQLIWSKIIKVNKEFQKENRNNPDKKKLIIIAEFFLSLYDTICCDRKYFFKKGIVAIVLKILDIRVLKKADLVVTDTASDAIFFSKMSKRKMEDFDVMYLEADPEIYHTSNISQNKGQDTDDTLELTREERCERFLRKRGLIEGKSDDSERKEEYKVLYFGTGLPLQGNDIVVRAFATLGNAVKISHIDNKILELVYIGRLSRKNKKIVNKIPNLTYYPWLSQEKLAGEIESADLCLAGHFNATIDKADRTIPGKAFIYEKMNKRMILTDTKANHELFEKDYRHLWIERGSSKELVRVIWECYYE